VTLLWRYFRSQWPGWTIFTPLPFVAHSAWAAARGAFHWENAAILLFVLTLFALGRRGKKLMFGAYPIGLVAILYESMSLVRNAGLTPETVHDCDLRQSELGIFGLTMNGERVTYHEWLQQHSSPVLDALCAVPYGTFIFVCMACAAWLYVRDYPRMVRFTWCFLALNITGFVTYHLYPAAPPWYFHAHGCAIDLSAHASAGPNLTRVDAWMGVPYFQGMYGRSSDVFGAMPSLHCSYALIVAIEGWAVFSRAWRAASCAFFVLMCFSAVYLDHHWVLDTIAGIVYCVAVIAAARALARLWTVRTSRSAPLLEGSAGEGAS
jgi:membrane-associated phospholipid phosphatase